MAQPGGCWAPASRSSLALGTGTRDARGSVQKQKPLVTRKHREDVERRSPVFPPQQSAPKNSSPKLEPSVSRLPMGKPPFFGACRH